MYQNTVDLILIPQSFIISCQSSVLHFFYLLCIISGFSIKYLFPVKEAKPPQQNRAADFAPQKSALITGPQPPPQGVEKRPPTRRTSRRNRRLTSVRWGLRRGAQRSERPFFSACTKDPKAKNLADPHLQGFDIHNGAVDGTWTHTLFTALAPQTSVSAYSTTTAFWNTATRRRNRWG